MSKFSKETSDALKRRGDMFRSLPVSDRHQIIAFEKIVRNYLNMIKALRDHEEQIEQTEKWTENEN